MGVATGAGTRVYIGTTAASAASDSFVEIGEVGAVPEFGRQYDEIKWRPVSTRATQKLKGGYDDGGIQLPLGKDASDAGQAAILVALDVDAYYNFKIVDNDDVVPASATVTMATGSPGQITDTGHGLAANTPVKFTTTGALLTGLTAGTTYYVKTVVDADTYTVSATPGGSAINLSSTQSGTHTRTTVPVGTTTTFKAQVMSYRTNRGDGSDIVKAVVDLSIKSGSISETARLPAA